MSIATLPLGEISTEIVTGIACGKANAIADGVLHLRPFSVTPDGSLSVSDAPRIPASVIPNGRLGFQTGDILFNNTNSVELVGKSAVFSAPLEASFSNHMTRVRIDAAKADPRYVQAFLRHLYHERFFEGRATRWVGQAAFGSAQLKTVEIPLPPLEEQRRIIGLLDRTAEIRHRADATRAKARAIIPALFLDMFGDPATNPKGWPVVPLGNLLDRIDGGWSPVCGGDLAPEQWGVLKLSAVKSFGFFGSEAKRLPETIAPREDLEVHEGDLLITRKNTIDLVGTAAVADGSGRKRMLPDTIFRLIPNDPARFLPGYVCTLINLPSFRPAIRQLASGSASSMPGISKGRLSALEIPLPELPLQTAFAEQAQRLEATARALDLAAAKAEAMASSLSAEIFA